MVDEPEELFEQYGPAVLAEIHRHLRRSGTLGPLLRQLGLVTPRTMEEQYEILQSYLNSYGAVHFLNELSLTDPANTHVRRRALRTEGVRPPLPLPRPGGGAEPSGSQSAPEPGSPAPSDLPPPSFSRRISRPYKTGRIPTSTTLPDVSASPSPPPPPGEAFSSAPDLIRTPAYSGPERRSGLERRRGPADRRAGLETVFKNRRYGGWDRRRETRREQDRLKAQDEKKIK